MWLLHLFLSILFGGWIIPAIVGYIRSGKEKESGEKDAKFSSFNLVINSAVLYAIAYNMIYFIQEFFLAWGKYLLGLKAFLYNNNHSWQGTHPQVRLAQGYGAVAILTAGIIFTVLFFLMGKKGGWIRLLVFWLAYQGIIQSLPQFATCMMAPDTDTGQAYTYLHLQPAAGIAISVTSIVLLIIFNLLSGSYLLEFSPSLFYVSTGRKRFGYLFRIAVIAAFAGVLLIIPFQIPPVSRIVSAVMVTILSIPWLFANGWRNKKFSPAGSSINSKILLVPILLLIMLLLFFKIVLAKGIVFTP